MSCRWIINIVYWLHLRNKMGIKTSLWFVWSWYFITVVYVFCLCEFAQTIITKTIIPSYVVISSYVFHCRKSIFLLRKTYRMTCFVSEHVKEVKKPFLLFQPFSIKRLFSIFNGKMSRQKRTDTCLV